MNAGKTALHILQRMKADPRLAALIGPGSDTFELLVRDAALAQDLDIDVARRIHQPNFCPPFAPLHGNLLQPRSSAHQLGTFKTDSGATA